MDFDFGTNYSGTVEQGADLSFWRSGYHYDLASVNSSDPSVVKVYDQTRNSFFLLPKKAGTAVITVTGGGNNGNELTTKIKIIVKPPKSTIKSKNWIHRSTKKVTVIAANVKKGDVIKLKIGGRIYKKTIRKPGAKRKVKINIKQPGFYGKKYKLSGRVFLQ